MLRLHRWQRDFPHDPALFRYHPLDFTDDFKAPVLGLYGGCDDPIPLDTIQATEARLKTGCEAARTSRIQIYPDGPHAFFADYRDSYRADLASDAWHRCLAWLKQQRSH